MSVQLFEPRFFYVWVEKFLPLTGRVVHIDRRKGGDILCDEKHRRSVKAIQWSVSILRFLHEARHIRNVL